MSNLTGKELDAYRILEQIGVGGMSTVYKAYHTAMDRNVAVKVMSEQMGANPQLRERFQREAKVVAKLEHAHILPVHDYGQVDNQLYLVMRYIEAGTLKERIAGEPMTLDEINRVVSQVGTALDYAHHLGVVHRDIKPSNVLYDDQGNCYLTDFGLARILEDSIQLTGTGVGVGTPAYMSPEQGQGDKADARSDIYSLGVMLYEMVTGEQPYQAETPLAVILKHIQAELPLPRSVDPSIPQTVEQVILKAMAKDPDHRYQTAGEMVRALDRAVRMTSEEEWIEAPVSEPAMEREPVPTVAESLTQVRAAVQNVMRVKWARAVAWTVAGIAVLAVSVLFLSRMPFWTQRDDKAAQEVTNTPIPSATTVSQTPVSASIEEVVVHTATPIPTSTSLPASTATTVPAAIPLSSLRGELLFEDDFDDNKNDWTRVNEDWCWIEDGLYHMALEEGMSKGIFSESYLEQHRNFVYEARFLEIEISSRYGYGLSFRVHHPGSHWYQRFYTLDIRPREQVYNCERVDFTVSDTGAGWPSALAWRAYVPSLNSQATTHTLTVIAQENEFTLYIDDQFIATLVDPEDLYQEGVFGFGAEGAHIAVDYVRLWALAESTAQ